MKKELSSLKRKEDEVRLNASSEQRDSPVGKFIIMLAYTLYIFCI